MPLRQRMLRHCPDGHRRRDLTSTEPWNRGITLWVDLGCLLFPIQMIYKLSFFQWFTIHVFSTNELCFMCFFLLSCFCCNQFAIFLDPRKVFIVSPSNMALFASKMVYSPCKNVMMRIPPTGEPSLEGRKKQIAGWVKLVAIFQWNP